MLYFILLSLCILNNVQLIISQSFLTKYVDFQVEQFNEHKTKEFYTHADGLSDVIIRRGATFKFFVELNTNYDGEEIRAIFKFDTSKDSMVITLTPGVTQNGWKLSQSVSGDKVNVEVIIPGNAPVGLWSLKIQVLRRTEILEDMDIPNRVILLFNPWSQDDAAYFPEQHKLSEYLLNENGYTYSYDYKDAHASPWIYGQFQPKMLDAILLVLSKSTLKASERGNIVSVTRELTHLMNDLGGRHPGVLRGRWNEPYDTIDGRPATKPWEWTGSPAILMKYYESGGTAVGYGQCWVFAAILTTAYRALGIASRPVSNLLSAHSDSRDLTIDIRLDRDGKIKTQELVWNFHVWTQAWFSRSDLGHDFGGWQELDATPQELNDRRYQVGPASNVAVGKSDLQKKYETDFLYEEANADQVVWSADGEIVEIDTSSVGKALLTKEYGGEGEEDLVRSYKPPENTEEERNSYRAAAKSLKISPPSLRNNIVSRASKKQIIIDIQAPNNLTIGTVVNTKVVATITTLLVKPFKITVRASAMYYNGEVASILKEQTFVATEKVTTFNFDINPDEYIGKLYDKYTIRIEAASVNGREVSFRKNLFSLQTPELRIEGPEAVNVQQSFTMNLHIQNPFNQLLKNCYVAVEGTRIPRQVIRINDIKALSSIKAPIQLQSLYPRKEIVIFQFYTNNLKMKSSFKFVVNGYQNYHFSNYIINENNSTHINHNNNNNNGNGRVNSITNSNRKATRIMRKDFRCCRLEKIR